MGAKSYTTEIITCDDCGEVLSESDYKKEYITVEQHKEKSWDLDHEWWKTDVYRYDYTYDCPKCKKHGWIRGENRYSR